MCQGELFNTATAKLLKVKGDGSIFYHNSQFVSSHTKIRLACYT
jgi:hypothetical protein